MATLGARLLEQVDIYFVWFCRNLKVSTTGDPTRRPDVWWIVVSSAFGAVLIRTLIVVTLGNPGPAQADPKPLCDLWAWDGSDWSEISAENTGPCLAGATMGWDATNHRLIVAGGFLDAYSILPNYDTWYFEFTGPSALQWSKGTEGACAPLAAARGSYDPENAKFVFFGGTDPAATYDATLVCSIGQ